MSKRDRAHGVLLGLACGDALGRPVEFKSAARIAEEYGTVTEMIGHGSHRQPAGTVTDDTEMALCIARSLIDQDDFDADDIADRFLNWYHDGPFDIGLMTADALRQLNTGKSWDDAGRIVWEHRSEGQNAGNGSVMRCAPLALAYDEDPERLVETSRQSSAITHYDPRCQYGSAILNLTITNLLHDRDRPLQSALEYVEADAPDELVTSLRRIPGSVSVENLDTSGYVVTTLETALYDGLVADSTRDAIVTAVNRGGDTDTIGAIAGAVAGARNGPTSIPETWLSVLTGVTAEELRNLADELLNGVYR
jgi:ADP-ribosyl-[dinitrogen reductase] hydrolase